MLASVTVSSRTGLDVHTMLFLSQSKAFFELLIVQCHPMRLMWACALVCKCNWCQIKFDWLLISKSQLHKPGLAIEHLLSLHNMVSAITALLENWLAIAASTRHHLRWRREAVCSLTDNPPSMATWAIVKSISVAILLMWYWCQIKEHIRAGARVNQTLEYGLPAKAARKTACWSCTVVQLCTRTRKYASCFSVANFRYESFHLQINPAIVSAIRWRGLHAIIWFLKVQCNKAKLYTCNFQHVSLETARANMTKYLTVFGSLKYNTRQDTPTAAFPSSTSFVEC